MQEVGEAGGLEGQVVAQAVLLGEDGLNHHLVYGLVNYHTFAKQILLGLLSLIYVEFYYRVVYVDDDPLEEVGR